jgi:hypothetical protein
MNLLEMHLYEAIISISRQISTQNIDLFLQYGPLGLMTERKYLPK